MSDMSMCLWVRIPDPEVGHIYTFVSYAIKTNGNEITMENPYKRDGTDTFRLLATIAKRMYWYVEDVGFEDWTFWCFTLNFTGDKYLLYLNGHKIKQESEHEKSKNVNKRVQGGGILILGQDQDSLGGGFQDSQAFQGHLTEFNLWNQFVDEREIQLLMCGLEYHSAIVSWAYSRFQLFEIQKISDTTRKFSSFSYLIGLSMFAMKNHDFK
ncbi:neuronal pentraxin-2-like [Ptychodera flava]|uniref:neuronal pentraxin-2-like n=1 Tax=Ptychodera flava TaxID=63121 RepID=UPI003969E711